MNLSKFLLFVIFRIFCMHEVATTVDLPTFDEYIDLLTVYSTFRHISVWTHFSCSSNGTDQIHFGNFHLKI